ncbi:MAG: PEP-CTERM sorting domain-containing protein [Coleofasciculus sp. D1-CHI-01]|uniref:PEP-CTERM sorting domain-containing protein n=1 Tax=Coleofasciculus sp. D1-CHI-01 TaxID=3068482 RepID=UPI003304343B
MAHKLKFAIAMAGAVVGLTALHANPAQAAVMKTIDFEEFEHGDVVTGVMTEHATLGVFSQGNVNQNFPNAGEPRDLMIFDTDCGPGVDCSADSDLDFGNQFGKALIISFDNNSDTPNDSQVGGVITFDFNMPVIFKGFNLLDDEEEFTKVSLFNGANLVQEIDGIVGPGDNQAIFVDGFTTAQVTRVEIDLPGSGAIDNITYNKVPEPLTILGSTMALGFGALFKKQQSKQQKKN